MESDKDKTELKLPWVEKYRPQTLADLISQKDVISTINRFIDEKKLPHLLFYGPPGTGKTSAILAAAKRMYRPKEIAAMVLELNASDDRGIGVVREEIVNFAQTKTLSLKKEKEKDKCKLVILDEADAMTSEAQNALRRIIEKYTANVRFCLICNYLTKIIPAIQSRCTRFRFAPLVRDQMLPRLREVSAKENVQITADGENALLTLSQGDMRRLLNVLQSTSMSSGVVNETTVHSCIGHPMKNDVHNIATWLLTDTIENGIKNINRLKVDKGIALCDILTEIHLYVQRLQMETSAKVKLLKKMADIEYRMAEGSSEKVQLGALMAAFIHARHTITN